MLERLFPQQADDRLVVEDVFSVYLYTGNGSTQTITNGIDLAGKGGLVWVKRRDGTQSHGLMDTLRGTTNTLFSDTTGAASTAFNSVTAYNSNGFTVGTSGVVNTNTAPYASWTFRKAPKFFDVVTYTGNGGTQNIAHSLGVAPGMIIVKNTTSDTLWSVWHRSVNGGSAYAVLNLTDAFYTSFTELVWGNNTTYVAPTTTQFTVGESTRVNQSGNTFVAYLFAHDPSADGIIQCGTFNNSGGSVTVTLGWEPQWILMKNAAGTGDWFMVDNMRGMPVGGSDPYLYANSSASENSGDIVTPTATGFVTVGLPGSTNFIYMAIRRGPMRTPTLGTSVFSPVVAVSGAQTTGFPVDMQLERLSDITSNTLAHDRLRGVVTTDSNSPSPALYTNTTNSEITGNNGSRNWNNTGFTVPNVFSGGNGIYWNFRRAPGFFDVVCYTGTGAARTVNHNLGVAPELYIFKSRSNTQDWFVFGPLSGATKGLARLNTSSGYTSSVSPNGSATTFDLGASLWNESGYTFVAYLFASVPGVSKVGSYTGNGSSQTINCAFTTGARFVLIKRTDSTGDWWVWDTARGIVSANDPALRLNSTAAETTGIDSVDPDSTGFVVNQDSTTNINVNAATYIFLAIA